MWKTHGWRDVRLGIKDLMLHKLRSLLTMLGVIFGVASVIAMLAVGEGASRQALDQIRRLGSRNIILTSVKPVADEGGQPNRNSFMSVYGLLEDDFLRIRETIAWIQRVVPVRLIRKMAALGERSLELRVVGTTPDWFTLVRRPVIAGRILGPNDDDQSNMVCILTERGARRLLATKSVLGQKIRLGGSVFEVIGIVASAEAGGAVQAPDQNVDVYIPLSASLSRYGRRITYRTSGTRELEQVELHQILVEVTEEQYVEEVARALEAMLQRFHKKTDVKISIPLTLLRQAEATKRTFNIVLGSIAGISLLVGGIGIMNIMLASVTERTREIGIRRAIGARRGQIVMQFLIETVVLSGLGGVIGIGVGFLIPLAISRLSGLPTQVPLYGLALSFGISVLIGIVFGLYPAFRAANLKPIEALRYE